jgi:uncharacterized protein
LFLKQSYIPTRIVRVAIDNPGKVDKIVLMGAAAQNLRELVYFQIVKRPVLYAQQVLDHDHNGLISVQEASENPTFSSLVQPLSEIRTGGNITLLLTQNITTANGTIAKQLRPQYNTNNDTFISINDELKTTLDSEFNKSVSSLLVVIPGEKCPARLSWTCPIWLRSYWLALTPTLDIIGKVPTDTSILIMQGKNDSSTLILQAFLLQQKLTELKYPYHTLLTYPDLGHGFSPSSQWLTAGGPMEQKVLEDLFGWLSDPVRDIKKMTILSSQVP